MARSKNDLYANMASAEVTIVDASMTYTELQTGISLGQNVGILIDGIEYYTNSAEANLSATKNLSFGWTVSNAPTSFDINDRRFIHYTSADRVDMGTAGNGVVFKDPKAFEFAPPIIIANPRLYLAVYASSSSGANGVTIASRFRFRYVNLTDKEYLEIAESFILVG